jgi:catechol 2,3-dioxygenase-like lactoylglutathione lyase family enzyme
MPATDPPVRLSKISMVILFVRDAMASLAFYRDVLGMTPLEASLHWVELEAGGVHLAPVDDPRAVYETMTARGVKFMGPPKEVVGDATSVGLSADLLDPDGNRLSLFGMVPRT